MAIYATSQSLPGGKTKGPGASTQEVVIPFIVAVSTAMIDNANDEVGLAWVPKGFMPTGIVFNTTDMDSSTGLLWDVGDDGDEDRLIAAFSGQAAGTSQTLRDVGLLYKYTARTLIKAYVNTAATTGVAGTLKGVLKGIVDEDYDTTPLVAA
ncbi:hypothetical protein Hden_1580 [Hyphomicrobium denitrificans ATCC 51888]|jgi:hypothetical protein|uniref:Bacteriophage protein n=1 Tax=Hyphomicrobium denitrificans (strain ATCC 51888 / DSM 1869 / NCIMB 11706 / TK 0415) TaxID=582899 RepID=D8JQ67_HYPDA|nr:hypothetical protein [Hyphomicrobium denitrificans]ADJ21988.1 hypothetical protein Hden_0161 [Hyphomicrobium denitrificans ATCC 51888]ADJ23388.1 hypothetical protein Hden_1580 [Hyphomicrobium denitrificans ATCC 51888]HNI20009.1 hypothetical protein [Nitrospira sp.]